MIVVPVGQSRVQIAVGSVDGEQAVYLEEQSVSASGRTTRGARVFVPLHAVSPTISALMAAQDAVEAAETRGGLVVGRLAPPAPRPPRSARQPPETDVVPASAFLGTDGR